MDSGKFTLHNASGQLDDRLIRVGITVSGRVQGVGFRPFLWRIAAAGALSGFCCNTSAGVHVEIQGQPEAVRVFERRLDADLPPLAQITSLTRELLPVRPGEKGFVIRESHAHAGQNVLVSPDIAVCRDCLADIRAKGNRRFGYAFANCTNCGPRFSITRRIPYDRPGTTMACFELCADCRGEYMDPADRRFHAQPVACPECGPAIWFVARPDCANGQTTRSGQTGRDALALAGAAILRGEIIALRGLGGFQLACDARSSKAVAELRRRKNRPHKALAVMAADPAGIRTVCNPGKTETSLLAGPQAPVVLCKARTDIPLTAWICPDSANIGIMLPCTPLHALLLDWLGDNGMESPLLVMTSANPQGEPICLGNREALARLGQIADGWLLHDRDILCRVDDSVVGVINGAPVFLRRARGYVPDPLPLAEEGPCILGAGGDLKSAFCLSRGAEAFMSQHIGDLDSPACMDFYEEALLHLQSLLEVEPKLVVHDLHPNFISTNFARDFARMRDLRTVAIQHHVAHAASCLAENNIYEPALALCLDGSGLGVDGFIWGCELLYVDLRAPAWRRLGSLAPFHLPGGEAAIRQPWRLAVALRWQLGRNDFKDHERAIAQMLDRGLNCPLASSCGRLFDAVAAQIGVCREITYEGQAAMKLEKLARDWLAQKRKPLTFSETSVCEDSGLRLDSGRIFASILDLQERKENPGAIAATFHYALAAGLAEMAAKAAKNCNVRKVALTGGVMQNALLGELLPAFLREYELEPFTHHRMPPGDGGLAFGQVVWGAQLLASRAAGSSGFCARFDIPVKQA